MSNTVGLDIGGTLIKALRLGEDGEVERREAVPVPSTPEALLEAARQAVEQVRSDATTAVGVGMAGLVRWPEGIFVWGPHLPWVDLPVRAHLHEAVGLPVRVDNDANCAVLAEARVGAARGVSNVVLITIGTGIGGGLLLNGDLYRGSSFGGELGHMTMVTDGAPCACGGRGCWETVVSNARLEPWLESARAGDREALARLEEIGNWLGRGLALVATALDPDLFVIGGGGGAAAGEFLLPAARAAVGKAWAGSRFRESIPVVAAEAGAWAGALGAGIIARDDE